MKRVQVNVFTDGGSGGCPVQVFICRDGMLPASAGMIEAAGVGDCQETAFVTNDGRRIKIESLKRDGRKAVPGNGSVAAFRALIEEGLALPGEDYDAYVNDFRTSVKTEKRFISMNMPQSRVLSMVKMKESIELIFRSLGAEYEPVSFMPACGCFRNMEPMVVEAGEPVLIVPVNGRERLNRLEPNMALVAEICKGLKCAGIYAFAFETKDIGTMAHCRGFYPLEGIDESASSPAGVAALSFYLNGFGLFPQGREAVFYQGETMGACSKLIAFIKGKGVSMEILVGGEACTADSIS